MQFAAEEIVQITQDIFSTMLLLDVVAAGDAPPLRDDPRLTACVQIAGAWKGAVVFDASVRFARQVAAIMFDMAAGDTTAADLQDALAELANMIGGNLKSLLPGPSFVSLPSVTEGNDYSLSVPGTRLISRVQMDCQDELLEVALLEEEPQCARSPSCSVAS
jgi:chemotaxis protein CheX